MFPRAEDESDCYMGRRGEARKDGKGRRLWKKVKYQLVEYHSLPNYLKDNEYILGYYRSEWPLKQTLFSIFTIHNETLNVWTHLIGFFLFLALTIYTAVKVPKVVDIHSLQQLPEMLKRADLHKLQSDLVACLPALPQLSHLHRLKEELRSSLPTMDSLSSLTRWHLVELISNCFPQRLSHPNQTQHSILNEVVANLITPLFAHRIPRWPFFAFLGIAALISTSFYPPVYYSFMCDPFFCNLYLGLITLLGCTTMMVSLLPVFQNPEYRSIRAGLFFGMGISGVVPVLHKLIAFRNQPEAVYTTQYEVLMGILYGLGALLYATRIPERWMPGKFDIAGHSHQLFHVLVVAGALTHYKAGLVYLKWRDLQGCAK
ncbi:hypothetical protein IEQ34_020584 [Dendrobium chrysotoxum]|uniref:Uncharacterized protein n=1 Tax=Dendrobium chrysotoxum TaxID=161865 RepID=A0AAV7G172_DENCH|nr:hypothetical protein IEQ34_020584 [Dendrobium chrysotoxum]